MKRISPFLLILLSIFSLSAVAQTSPKFKAIGFYTGKNDQAHISFLHEANKWFSSMASTHNFEYDSTGDWNNLNDTFLKKYQVVIFLDTRPESPARRAAFEKYMKNGGAWIGFHFAAFAMNGSGILQDWTWYHNDFLGSGEYVSNTWRPTSAVLRVEQKHPVTRNFPTTFRSSPNEWYRWKNDLRKNPDIKILVSIDSSSFPLGTGPKPHEIWHSGYYPVVWANTKYKMIYFNMGHNDIDYEHNSDKELSFTFGNPLQDKLVLNSLLWLGSKK
ncbi:ThuA domain-containing protein [Ferruginibacter sp. HRS2-29]|uniref:ThuA domain-containing protein n=1 Tax=Ferruginibacter sp. HRS2-29 TaxID=2487334 RepID=UPI0020CC81B7|nr:ThuA domain-containing protein [Ferruginibacter sp. HRS2-29]MCP9753210.1 ThuA domain-containing protein [Ferruginibacter sp. HRS2-29]